VWSDEKRARFGALKNSRQRGTLDAVERAELDALEFELDREEEASLAASRPPLAGSKKQMPGSRHPTPRFSGSRHRVV
jgi:hypothetical protein